MKLALVTSNEGKLGEMRQVLEREGHELAWRKFPYPEVQSSSLAEVVEEGLSWLRPRLGEKEAFLIEDSGLFVTALKDFPGVFSAYSFKALGNAGILKLLEGAADRRARFESCIGLWLPGRGQAVLRGTCEGVISTEARGSGGFGYDPIFIPAGEERTFAEMTREQKNLLSHRGRALSLLVEHLRSVR